ncbi:MAG: DOMON domain-containing protein [Candidatus Bipolaricaulia bacterium]
MTFKKGIALAAVLVVVALVGVFTGSIPAASQGPAKIDGQIAAGEYQYQCVVDISKVTAGATFKMSFSWTIDKEFIYVGMQAPATGWVGWGLMNGTPGKVIMQGSDLIIGYVKDGQVFIEDTYGDTIFSHKPDTALTYKDKGGQEHFGVRDIVEAAGTEDTAGTTIEFKRKLYTGDFFDLPVPVRGEVYVAYSDVDDFGTVHKGKGEGRSHRLINLMTGESSTTAPDWTCGPAPK